MRTEKTMSVMKCWKLKNRWRGYNWLSRSQKAEFQSHSRKSKEQTDIHHETSKRLQSYWCWLVLKVGDASGWKTRVWVKSLLRKLVPQLFFLLCAAHHRSSPAWQVCSLGKGSVLFCSKAHKEHDAPLETGNEVKIYVPC